MPFYLCIILLREETASKGTIKKLLKKSTKNTFNKQENMNFLLKEYNTKDNFNNNKKTSKTDMFRLPIIFNLSLLDWVTLSKLYPTFKFMKIALKFVLWQ